LSHHLQFNNTQLTYPRPAPAVEVDEGSHNGPQCMVGARLMVVQQREHVHHPDRMAQQQQHNKGHLEHCCPETQSHAAKQAVKQLDLFAYYKYGA